MYLVSSDYAREQMESMVGFNEPVRVPMDYTGSFFQQTALALAGVVGLDDPLRSRFGLWMDVEPELPPEALEGLGVMAGITAEHTAAWQQQLADSIMGGTPANDPSLRTLRQLLGYEAVPDMGPMDYIVTPEGDLHIPDTTLARIAETLDQNVLQRGGLDELEVSGAMALIKLLQPDATTPFAGQLGADLSGFSDRVRMVLQGCFEDDLAAERGVSSVVLEALKWSENGAVDITANPLVSALLPNGDTFWTGVNKYTHEAFDPTYQYGTSLLESMGNTLHNTGLDATIAEMLTSGSLPTNAGFVETFVAGLSQDPSLMNMLHPHLLTGLPVADLVPTRGLVEYVNGFDGQAYEIGDALSLGIGFDPADVASMVSNLADVGAYFRAGLQETWVDGHNNLQTTTVPALPQFTTGVH